MEDVEKIKIWLDEVTQLELFPGAIVLDDLTKSPATIIRLAKDKNGNLGIWLDNNYLGGSRHPWEISPPKKDWQCSK